MASRNLSGVFVFNSAMARCIQMADSSLVAASGGGAFAFNSWLSILQFRVDVARDGKQMEAQDERSTSKRQISAIERQLLGFPVHSLSLPASAGRTVGSKKTTVSKALQNRGSKAETHGTRP